MQAAAGNEGISSLVLQQLAERLLLKAVLLALRAHAAHAKDTLALVLFAQQALGPLLARVWHTWRRITIQSMGACKRAEQEFLLR